MPKTNETLAITPTPADAAVQTCLCLLLLILGVLGNGMICFFVWRFKSFRTIPNILLTNLATVDLLNIIIIVPLSVLTIVYDVKALRTKSASWWTALVLAVFLQLNLASMLLLVVDRYFALAHPIRYISWKSHSKTFCGICAAWIYSLLFTGYLSIALRDIELVGKSYRYYFIEYLKGLDFRKYLLPGLVVVVGLIIVFSSLTVREILRKSLFKTAENGLRSSGSRTKTSKKVNSACTIMIVLLAYIVCFAGRISLSFASLNSNEPSQWYIFLVHFCVFCGSTCNSFIYAARSTEFRKAWRETFKFKKPFKSQVQDSQKKAGKVFYINDVFGKKVVVVQ